MNKCSKNNRTTKYRFLLRSCDVKCETNNLISFSNRKVNVVSIDKNQECINTHLLNYTQNSVNKYNVRGGKINYYSTLPPVFPIHIGCNKHLTISPSEAVLFGDNSYCFLFFDDDKHSDIQERFTEILNTGFNNICNIRYSNRLMFKSYLTCQHFVQYLMLGKNNFEFNTDESRMDWYKYHNDVTILGLNEKCQFGDIIVLLINNVPEHLMFYIGGGKVISKIGEGHIMIHNLNNACHIYLRNKTDVHDTKCIIVRRKEGR